jgi:hypothetical protein
MICALQRAADHPLQGHLSSRLRIELAINEVRGCASDAPFRLRVGINERA